MIQNNEKITVDIETSEDPCELIAIIRLVDASAV